MRQHPRRRGFTRPLLHLAVMSLVHTGFSMTAVADEFRPIADRPVDIRHIRLDLDVDLPHKHVDAVASIELTPLREVSSVAFDAVNFETSAVAVAVAPDSLKPARYANDGKRVEVFFERPLSAGQDVSVQIRYAIDEPKGGLSFFGPSDDDPDAPYQVWSQGQSISNRNWIPCFDHTNERQTTEIVATVDEKYRVLSNGTLEHVGPAKEAGRTVYHWRQSQPHVIYLVTLVVGDFHVHEETWRGKPVMYWVPPDRKDDAVRSLGRTPDMLELFSRKIGVEYPWDKYALVCCYNYGGGMENTSATTIGENSLHDERAHLDTSADGLLAHELAHQWWGDYLTCRDWSHLWLNEGFASYFEIVWSEHDLGAEEAAYDLFEKTRGATSDACVRRPLVDRFYGSPDDMFDSRSYPKGAWVLHMIRCRLGDELFWKALQTYANEHKLDLVESVDLRHTIERVSGRSFDRFFYDWTERSGHPILDVTTTWNESSGMAEVVVKQVQGTPEGAPRRGGNRNADDEAAGDEKPRQPDPKLAEPFHFPLTVEFRVGEGDAPVVVQRDVTARETTLTARLPRAPSMVRIDPGNTILKELRETKGRDLWLAQLTGDPDVAGRILAAQELGRDKSDANRAALAAALQSEKFWGVQSEIAGILGPMGGDPARDALLATLRSPNPRTRRACVSALRNFPADAAVIAAVRALVETGDPAYGVEEEAIEVYGAMAPADALDVLSPVLQRDSDRERIRSAALRAIAGLKNARSYESLLEWCAPERPMPCRRAALSAIASLLDGTPPPDELFDKICERIGAALDGQDRRQRQEAIRAAGLLKERGEPFLPKLRKLAADATRGGARRAVREAIDKITATPRGDRGLGELRAEVEALKTQVSGLVEQLERARTASPQ